MSKFFSELAPALDAMLDYREALGFSRTSHMPSLINFDFYCAKYYPGNDSITKEMVLNWINRELDKPQSNISSKASAVRVFGKYLAAIGKEAYILPSGYVSRKTISKPHIFNDSELSALFAAADNLHSNENDAIIAPVLFRMIYTCGLRPNEGRELERDNINLSNGELFITKTKRKKERIVVMSDDMLSMCIKYNEIQKTRGIDSIFFFPDQDGNAYPEQKLDRLFKRCWSLANPSISTSNLPNVRTYDLRHRFASAILNRWLDEGRDLYVMLPYLREYMGHLNMSETAHYIHILPENLVKSSGIDWSSFEAIVPEVDLWQE